MDQVGDDDVGVKLGVAGPAGAVPEGGSDEPVGFDELVTSGPPAGVTGFGGEVVKTAPTARSWATEIVSRTSPGPNAQSSETPLGAENVRS